MNKERPVVTVIIPSFNHAQYISEAIESVLNQTYENIELIVVDDGSTDDSHEVLSALKPDPRLTVVLNKENRGQSAVVNQALSMAKGEYVALLPSDDYYLPNKIELQVSKFIECDADVGLVYGRGARYFPDTGETIEVEMPMYRGWVLKNLVEWGIFVYPVTPLFRREVFEMFKPDERYKAEGEAIYYKLAIKYKFDFVDQLVAVMRDHPYNSGKNAVLMLRENEKYYKEFFARNDLPKDIIKLGNIPLARLYRTKALEFMVTMEESNVKLARECALKAFMVRPGYLFDGKLWFVVLAGMMPRFVAHSLINKFRK